MRAAELGVSLREAGVSSESAAFHANRRFSPKAVISARTQQPAG